MRTARLCGRGGVGRVGGIVPYPSPKQIDRFLGKYCLPTTSLAGGNNISFLPVGFFGWDRILFEFTLLAVLIEVAHVQKFPTAILTSEQGF